MDGGDNLFRVTKWLMLIAGIWRLELIGVSKMGRKMYTTYSIIIQVAYNTCLVSFIIKFSQLWSVDNDKAIECLSFLTIVFLVVIKVALCQAKQMTSLLRKAIDPVNSSYLEGDRHIRSILSSHSRYANILNVFITIYSFSLGLHLNVLGMVEYHNLLQKYGNDTENLEKPLLVIYWYPFDTNKYYGVVIFYQLATVLLTDLFNSAIQALISTIMIQLSAQLKILQHYFRNFARDCISGKQFSKAEAYQNLRRFIIKHQELISYIEDFNNALKYPILLEYVVSSLMLASVLVQILTAKRVFFNIQYFIILTFQFFVLSWNANEIKLQSQNLAVASYESDWYEQSPETKKLLFILTLRSKKPLSLNIGPFGPLTIDAAISRLKLAYSYVSLISSGNVG